jgi:hypothetical protein
MDRRGLAVGALGPAATRSSGTRSLGIAQQASRVHDMSEVPPCTESDRRETRAHADDASLITHSWHPSRSRGPVPRLRECSPVLAAVKQSALDRGCGPALFEDGGTGSKNGPGWVRSA